MLVIRHAPLLGPELGFLQLQGVRQVDRSFAISSSTR